MRDYITVLTREAKRAMALELSYELRTYIPNNRGLKMFAMSELNGEIKYQDEN